MPSATGRRPVGGPEGLDSTQMAGDRPAHGNALRTLVAAATGTVVALALAGCGGSSSPSNPSHAGSAAAKSRPRTVLVLTQTLGYHHASIPTARAALRKIAARDGRYRLVFLPSATRLTAHALGTRPRSCSC